MLPALGALTSLTGGGGLSASSKAESGDAYGGSVGVDLSGYAPVYYASALSNPVTLAIIGGVCLVALVIWKRK